VLLRLRLRLRLLWSISRRRGCPKGLGKEVGACILDVPNTQLSKAPTDERKTAFRFDGSIMIMIGQFSPVLT
jgi:hypothetical protein